MPKEEILEKTMNVSLFLERRTHEPELCIVLKNKWRDLVLSDREWEQKVKGFLEKNVD